MEKFNLEFNSKKFLILLTTVCLVFFIVVVKAFEYLPDSDTPRISHSMINNINVPVAENNDKNIENQTKEKNSFASLPIKIDNVDIEEVEAPKEVEIIPPPTELGKESTADSNLSKEDKIAQGFAEARKLKSNAKYINALDEYKNILALTKDKEIVAQCYEEIAEIYGAARRYGTALSYATKAYNSSPTTKREMLLARLYYKTGDLDKATTRVNNILRRDFSEDR